MELRLNLSKRFRIVFAAAIAGVGLLAALLWSIQSKTVLRWTEDVKLADGRLVTLKRSQVLRGFGSVKLGRGNAKQTLEIVHPNDPSQTIKWVGTDHLSTLAVFEYKFETYLLTKPQWGSSYDIYNCPDPPYLLFRYSAGVWAPLPLQASPIKTIAVNVTANVFDAEDQIRSSAYHLSIDQTQNKWVNDGRTKYVLDLTKFSEQIYRPGSDCRQHNYLYAN